MIKKEIIFLDLTYKFHYTIVVIVSGIGRPAAFSKHRKSR